MQSNTSKHSKTTQWGWPIVVKWTYLKLTHPYPLNQKTLIPINLFHSTQSQPHHLFPKQPTHNSHTHQKFLTNMDKIQNVASPSAQPKQTLILSVRITTNSFQVSIPHTVGISQSDFSFDWVISANLINITQPSCKTHWKQRGFMQLSWNYAYKQAISFKQINTI